MRDEKNNRNLNEKEIKMKRTITIAKGNQYDKAGYRISDGVLDAYGNISKRMDGSVGLTRNGNLQYRSDELDAAIRATMIDGLAREIVIGQDTAPSGDKIDDSYLCPKCHTHCQGDCQS